MHTTTTNKPLWIINERLVRNAILTLPLSIESWPDFSAMEILFRISLDSVCACVFVCVSTFKCLLACDCKLQWDAMHIVLSSCRARQKHKLQTKRRARCSLLAAAAKTWPSKESLGTPARKRKRPKRQQPNVNHVFLPENNSHYKPLELVANAAAAAAAAAWSTANPSARSQISNLSDSSSQSELVEVAVA